MPISFAVLRNRGLAAALTLFALAAPVSAQDGPRVSLMAGVSQFDLSGTGDALTTAVRVDGDVTPILLWEAGLGFSFPEQQFDEDKTTLMIPEAQVQLQRPGRFAPYLGIGAGVAFDFRGDDVGTRVDPTFSGAVGARFDLATQVGLRGELRVRGVGTGFEGSAAEWTLGLTWRP